MSCPRTKSPSSGQSNEGKQKPLPAQPRCTFPGQVKHMPPPPRNTTTGFGDFQVTSTVSGPLKPEPYRPSLERQYAENRYCGPVTPPRSLSPKKSSPESNVPVDTDALQKRQEPTTTCGKDPASNEEDLKERKSSKVAVDSTKPEASKPSARTSKKARAQADLESEKFVRNPDVGFSGQTRAQLMTAFPTLKIDEGYDLRNGHLLFSSPNREVGPRHEHVVEEVPEYRIVRVFRGKKPFGFGPRPYR